MAFAPLADVPMIASKGDESDQGDTRESGQVGTHLGTGENGPKSETLEVIGAKGGTRTPMGFPARS
jgi:hypothetical protein